MKSISSTLRTRIYRAFRYLWITDAQRLQLEILTTSEQVTDAQREQLEALLYKIERDSEQANMDDLRSVIDGLSGKAESVNTAISMLSGGDQTGKPEVIKDLKHIACILNVARAAKEETV